MLEIIKNLKPAQRLQAFLFVTIVTSLTSLLTVYLKTDDCKGIGDQYQQLVGNYTELMRINNQIIQLNNSKDRDLLVLGTIMQSLDSTKPVSKTTSKTTESVAETHSDALATIIRVDPDSDEPLPRIVASRLPEQKTITKTVEKTTLVKEIPTEKKQLIDSAMSILKKYQKKN